MSNIATKTRWEHDGTRHELTIARADDGCYYVVRMDGQFYATAESLYEAICEIEDITQACGLLCWSPLVA